MKIVRKIMVIILCVSILIKNPIDMKADMITGGYLSLYQEADVTLREDNRIKNAPLEHRIIYFLNGGVNSNQNISYYSKADLPLHFEEPYREGYNFAGWYMESSFQNKVSMISALDEDVLVLYAKWTKQIDDHKNVQFYSYHNTTTDSRRNLKLKNCEYSFLDDFVIPGMPATREDDEKQNRITDVSACPQGICTTPDYMLISAYTENQSHTLGCVHVFSKESGEYLATLGMRENSHLGGLTFDGENIWVCHSDSHTLEKIPYDFVRQIAAGKGQQVVNCVNLFEEYKITNAPSCVTYYNGKLFVATYTKMFHSEMVAYSIREHGLYPENYYRIPAKVQGVSFSDTGKVFLSISGGRKNSSYLKIYGSAYQLSKHPDKPMKKIEMPPCSEEIAIEDGNAYILFESASRKYLEGTDGKGESLSPLDKILCLQLAKL